MKGTILVVDDDDAIRNLIKAVLEDSGFTVVEAKDGEDAVAVARNQSPHLILLDVMLPRIDG
ncbi:MAG: response regulator, partial [Firmicutes bacterium]|nr:response regulator [Bacillota bacterium]